MPIRGATRINREAMQPWLPFACCTLLSSLAIVAPLVALMIGPTGTSSSDLWLPGFVCFLPMCFLFVGGTISQMRKEISALRRRVAALEVSGGATLHEAPLDANGLQRNQFTLKHILIAVAVLAVQFAIIAKLMDVLRATLSAVLPLATPVQRLPMAQRKVPAASPAPLHPPRAPKKSPER